MTENAGLSEKQLALLTSVANGGTTESAAREAGMNKRTADDYLLDARRKLGAKTTVHACAKAHALGLIHLQENNESNEE